jgi:hypothetical protein
MMLGYEESLVTVCIAKAKGTLNNSLKVTLIGYQLKCTASNGRFVCQETYVT